jgi:hypothetical protein
MHAAVIATMKFMHPQTWHEHLSEQRHVAQVPGHRALKDSRVKLDIACMLAHRSWYNSQGPVFRYICSDASPQCNQSYEVFVSAERMIRRSCIAGKIMSDIPPEQFVHRVLPVNTLGHGRADLGNKIHSLIHQTCLEYGADVQSVRSANRDVRQVLSDMGTEFGLANCADTVDEYFKGGHSSSQDIDMDRGFMFPFALQTPGLLHILDWVIRHTVEALPFWSKWQERCKQILKFFHSHNHRECAKTLVNLYAAAANDPCDIPHLLAALDVSPERFAKWRWKTLDKAVNSLAVIGHPVRFVFAHCTDLQKEMPIREGPIATALKVAVGDPATWDQTEALLSLLRRIMDFVSWIQGCDCHEAELLQRRVVVCPFKGCRAKSIGQELERVCSEMAQTRDELRPIFGSVDTALLVTAFNRMVSALRLKLHWVNEMPYLVWQVFNKFVE